MDFKLLLLNKEDLFVECKKTIIDKPNLGILLSLFLF